MKTAHNTRNTNPFQPGCDIPEQTDRPNTMHTTSKPVVVRMFAPDHRRLDGSAINPCAVYNLRNCFEYIRDFFAADAAARDIALSFEMDADISVAYWDMHSLRQLVFNSLLADAIANAQAGDKVSLRIEKSDKYTVEIRVENPGAPIPKAQHEQLFSSPSGSLHQAWLCVQSHKGTIGIADDGAAVRVELPLYALCIQ